MEGFIYGLGWVTFYFLVALLSVAVIIGIYYAYHTFKFVRVLVEHSKLESYENLNIFKKLRIHAILFYRYYAMSNAEVIVNNRVRIQWPGTVKSYLV